MSVVGQKRGSRRSDPVGHSDGKSQPRIARLNPLGAILAAIGKWAVVLQRREDTMRYGPAPAISVLTRSVHAEPRSAQIGQKLSLIPWWSVQPRREDHPDRGPVACPGI